MKDNSSSNNQEPTKTPSKQKKESKNKNATREEENEGNENDSDTPDKRKKTREKKFHPRKHPDHSIPDKAFCDYDEFINEIPNVNNGNLKFYQKFYEP